MEPTLDFHWKQNAVCKIVHAIRRVVRCSQSFLVSSPLSTVASRATFGSMRVGSLGHGNDFYGPMGM